MESRRSAALLDMMKIMFKPHPWHGLSLGSNTPDQITCYIEIVPTDTVKYEIEKTTGYLKVDRPQRYSNVVPCLYGLLPRTLCGSRVAAHASSRTGRPNLRGDEDPLDVCVLSERPLSHGDVILEAIPIGGLRMLDNNEVDEKIVAVLKEDALFGSVKDISELPQSLVQRMIHYFLTYKQDPGSRTSTCEITHVYDRTESHQVITDSCNDYDERFVGLAGLLEEALNLSAPHSGR